MHRPIEQHPKYNILHRAAKKSKIVQHITQRWHLNTINAHLRYIQKETSSKQYKTEELQVTKT